MTNSKKLKGKVSFINHEKQYAMVEYEAGGKKRVVNGQIDKASQQRWKNSGDIKGIHNFMVGDIVEFMLDHTPKGDRQMADKIEFKYNTAFNFLLEKAGTENSFLGYVKVIDGHYFVKEIETYFFLKLPVGKLQIPPEESAEKEPVRFSIADADNATKAHAVLFDNDYVLGFKKAMQAFKGEEYVDSVVQRVTPHSIYVSLFDKSMTGKLKTSDVEENLRIVGGEIPVKITHLSKDKLVLVSG